MTTEAVASRLERKQATPRQLALRSLLWSVGGTLVVSLLLFALMCWAYLGTVNGSPGFGMRFMATPLVLFGFPLVTLLGIVLGVTAANRAALQGDWRWTLAGILCAGLGLAILAYFPQTNCFYYFVIVPLRGQ